MRGGVLHHNGRCGSVQASCVTMRKQQHMAGADERWGAASHWALPALSFAAAYRGCTHNSTWIRQITRGEVLQLLLSCCSQTLQGSF